MRAVYINLDAAEARRESIELSFASALRPGWSLDRYPAVNVNAPGYSGPRLKATAGSGRKLSAGEEGCYLSHRAVIDAHARSAEPILVLEDDAVFAPESLEIIDGFCSSDQAKEWDVIFTDVIIPDASGMVELFRLKRALPPKKIQVLDLGKRAFAGSTAYIAMPGALSALPEFLRESRSERAPFDMALRSLVYRKVIRACVLFPFPTTVSTEGDASQIQSTSVVSSADLLWNAFRRIAWLGSNEEELTLTLQTIDEHYVDAPARALGTIVAAMGSKRYVVK